MSVSVTVGSPDQILVTAISENTYDVSIISPAPIVVESNAQAGPQGIKGDTGVGVPPGGTAKQRLVKVDSTDFNTQWADQAVGMNKAIQYNKAGTIAADVDFVYDEDLHAVSIGQAIFLPDNPLGVSANIPSYIQINIQNRNAGEVTSQDYVATANNGNDETNYIDMGINNEFSTDPKWDASKPNDGYLFVNGQNLNIGTDVEDKVIWFITDGFLKVNRRCKISTSGLDMVAGHKVSEDGFNLTDLIIECSSAAAETAAFAAGSKIVIRTDLL